MIQAVGLTLRYPDAERPALDGVALEVPTGEVLGVVGAMGAGKTSLCMTLAGLVPRSTGGQSTGELTVAGLDPRSAPLSEIARRVSLVFEDYASQLTQITVLAEVMAPMVNHGADPSTARTTARRLLHDLGLGHLDLDHKRTWELSGGQQQRVAIAAALATEPDVLMLDNVTGLLDPIGKDDIRRLVRDLSGRMTLVVVEEDIDLLVGVADHLLVLRDGRPHAQGPAEELLRDHALLEAAGIDPPTVVQVARAAGLDGAPLSAAEFGDVGHAPPAISHRPRSTVAESNHAVAVDHSTFRYPDGTTALDDVSLHVAPGEVHAVVGGNGAGKSTLLRMLCGLLRPSMGTVAMAGRDTRSHTPAELAHVVGTALQNPDEQLTERTVRAEIGFPLRQRRHRRTGWFRRELVISDDEIAEAVDRVRRLVGLPDTLLDADPTQLSRGHRKLVAIAGALALDPAVLILDEPRVSLDAAARATLRQLLHQLRERGVAVVIVEHDLDLVAETADTVTLLDLGTVADAGSPRDVLGHHNADVLTRASLRPPRVAQLAAELGATAITVAELAAQLQPLPQKA